MKVDETINAVLQEIQVECKKELKKDLSINELFEICNSQFVGGAVAFDLKVSFLLSYIGNFLYKNIRAYRESLVEMNKLKEQVSEEEYKEIIKEKKIANQNVLTSSNFKIVKRLEDLPEFVTESRSIVEFNRLYKKVLNSVDNE